MLYAGLREHEVEAERRERGIPYHPQVVDYYRGLCSELGVEESL